MTAPIPEPIGLPRSATPLAPFAQCRDCMCLSDSYMVTNEVWAQAFGGEHGAGHLCFECLSRRLARPLRIEDFNPNLPINRGILLGYRMAKPNP